MLFLFVFALVFQGFCKIDFAQLKQDTLSHTTL